MQELLRANIKRWPSSVSEDGLAISVWMEDYSLQRNGYRRCFELKFFDERSAQYFFEEFTQALPVGSLKGPSYYEMRHGKEIESEEDKCENEEEDNWNESEKMMKKGQTAAETCPLESDGVIMNQHSKRLMSFSCSWRRRTSVSLKICFTQFLRTGKPPYDEK